jgi:hypothetical protein
MDLNGLINPGLEALVDARGINNHGQILANSSLGHSYLLTPIPEPNTVTLLGIPLFGLLLRACSLAITSKRN